MSLCLICEDEPDWKEGGDRTGMDWNGMRESRPVMTIPKAIITTSTCSRVVPHLSTCVTFQSLTSISGRVSVDPPEFGRDGIGMLFPLYNTHTHTHTQVCDAEYDNASLHHQSSLAPAPNCVFRSLWRARSRCEAPFICTRRRASDEYILTSAPPTHNRTHLIQHHLEYSTRP